MRVQQCVCFARSQSREISIEHPSVGLASLAQLEKWFPLQGERGHSSYCRSFKKQNREEGETE